MGLPSPSDAAFARNNAGIFSRLGSTLLHTAPYVGPGYNIGSSIAHLFQGTLGQYGPATSPAGWLWSHLFSSNPTNAPRATAVDPNAPVAPAPVAPSTGSSPAYPQGAPQGAAIGTPGQTLGPGGIPMAVWQQVYNTGRFTGAPAFSRTVPQAIFSGSQIGPTSGLVTNPYVPGNPNFNSAGLARPGPWDTSIPGFAQTMMQYVRARNQI